MKHLAMFALFAVVTALAACTEPDHYPISGQECGPNDPVRDLDAGGCLPPV